MPLKRAVERIDDMPTRTNDFEIHVGFPSNLTGALRLLPDEPSGKWSSLRALQVITGLSVQGCFAAHDVPGGIEVLVTRRFTNLREAHDMVDEIAARFARKSDVRIELEQVLLCEDSEKHDRILPYADLELPQKVLKHARLVEDIPPFEAHYVVKSRDSSVIGHDMAVLIQLARDAKVDLHQAVRFGSKRTEEKIILTSYFHDYEEMLNKAQDFADRLRAALKRLEGNLQVKATAERILLCAEPK